jgi:hypothetical protein
VEFCETFVGEVISDLSEEEAAFGFSVKKRLIVRRRELELAIDIAGLAES